MQFFEIAYFTDIVSFEKFCKNFHRNLKLTFLFSTLFVYFKIGYRQSFITVLRISFFIIYELNVVAFVHSNVFYPSTSTLKMFYVNFFGSRFVTICLFCKIFIHYCFPDELLTFRDFPLLLYAMFFLSTNITKIDMKKNAKIGEIQRLELKIFFAAQPWWTASS